MAGTTAPRHWLTPSRTTAANHCGNAQPNFGFSSALVTQPSALISHGELHVQRPVGGTVVQFKLTVDPISGLTHYSSGPT